MYIYEIVFNQLFIHEWLARRDNMYCVVFNRHPSVKQASKHCQKKRDVTKSIEE